MIIMKKLDVLYKKYESNFPVVKHGKNRKKFSLLKGPLVIPFVQGRMSYDVWRGEKVKSKAVHDILCYKCEA